MVASFGYDAGSRRTSRTLADAPGTQTAWVYGRQDNLPTAINSGIPGASFTYTHDANKNKLTEGISAPMANFGFNSTAYDPADRLTAWNRTDGNLDQAWNLSLVGNWATFTENQVQELRTHTSVHEIATIDATSVVHDATGNLTRNASDTLDRYTWDFDNRLATADVDQDGTAECGYQYDARGRRVSKTVPDGEASVTTVFVGTIQSLAHSPHAMQVLAEYAADAVPASPERKFVYAEYIDEPIMMLATNGAATTPYYYHQNSLYSVAALTDATGAVVERYAYSAYGKPIFLDANANLLDPQTSSIGTPYLFTGRRLDEETGLYYYRARMYDAELGRFVGRDPIGYEAGDWSLYRYVFGSPLNHRDPSGASWFDDSLVSFFDKTGTPGIFLSLSGGDCYTRLDCTGECIRDQMGLMYKIILALAIEKGAIAGGNVVLPSNLPFADRIRQMLPLHKKGFPLPGQTPYTTSANDLFKKLPSGLKGILGKGFLKWLGRFNIAATIAEGLISLRVEAFCTALCGSMPSDWHYERPPH